VVTAQEQLGTAFGKETGDMHSDVQQPKLHCENGLLDAQNDNLQQQMMPLFENHLRVAGIEHNANNQASLNSQFLMDYETKRRHNSPTKSVVSRLSRCSVKSRYLQKLIEGEAELIRQKEKLIKKRREWLERENDLSDYSDDEFEIHKQPQRNIKPKAERNLVWPPAAPVANSPADNKFNLPKLNTQISMTQQPIRLERHHLAARHGISKDLPKFDGKPEEWPLFLAIHQTTELCGFSDAENLSRLRNALNGAARNAVKSLLLHAACVPRILATLEMRFGRPELIINALLAETDYMPTPSEDKLETIVDFALDVQNIVATMTLSGLSSYLNNPTLEQKFVSKLPGLLPAFWGMYKKTLKSCTLSDFSDWLFEFAEGANLVLVPKVTSKTWSA